MYRSSLRLPVADSAIYNQSNHSHDRSGTLDLPKIPVSNPPYHDASVRFGLQTPPEDIMGTTYQQPHYGSYSGRPDVQYQAGSLPGSHNDYALVNSTSRVVPAPSQPATTAGPFHGNKMDASITYATYTRPVSPTRAERQDAQSQQQKTSSNDQIMSNLQIPKTISKAGGSLAEFAAQVCWNLQI